MTKKDLLEIALIIFGLYTFYWAFISLVNGLEHYLYYFDKNTIPNYHLPIHVFNVIFYTCCFLVFTFRASWLAGKLLREGEKSLVLSINKTDLLQVLFACSGVLFMYSSLHDFYFLTLSPGDSDLQPHRLLSLMIEHFANIFQFVLGLVFIFAGNRLARMFGR